MRSHASPTTRVWLTVTSLVAAALAAVTGPSAVAASGSGTYTCALPAPLGSLDLPVTMTVPDLDELPAQQPVPADTVPVDLGFGSAALLTTITGLAASDLTLGLGDQTIPLHGGVLGDYDSSAHTLSGSAANDAFTLPEPGSYPITMPESFSLVGALGGTPFDIPCVTETPSGLGGLTVGLSSSTTKAKLVHKRIPRNHIARVRTTVTRQFGAPADGNVRIKRGRTKIGTGTLSGGTVTVRTAKFKKPGRYLLKVRYAGDDISAGSVDKVVVRVRRHRS